MKEDEEKQEWEEVVGGKMEKKSKEEVGVCKSLSGRKKYIPL